MRKPLRYPVVLSVMVLMASGTVDVLPAAAAPDSSPPAPMVDKPVAGKRFSVADPRGDGQSSRSVLPAVNRAPAAGHYSLDLSSGLDRAVGSTGISVRGAGHVGVEVLDQTSAQRYGLSGLVLRVFREDGASTPAKLKVSVPRAVLNSMYGADYAARVRFVQLPDSVGAQPTAITGAANSSSTVDATASMASASPLLIATVSAPLASNGSGDFAASSLSPSSAWQVSAQTGSFSWSYPLRVPPVAAGPEPHLALRYDSGAVDGRTGSTNNQPSWVGEGWDMAGGGFVERIYVPCADDGVSGSGDACWRTDNATVAFGGHSGTLVRDSTSGTWRFADDDGTRVQRLTGAANSDNDGEYWVLTTPDGVQYYFGLNHLPGWVTGKATTQSAWTVPVFGNNAGEPCHGTTFATSSCTQAWRWNLDYVVDPAGNSEAFYYAPETNLYAKNGTTATSYVRGGTLARIDYGMRKGSELTALAPQRVVFTPANRCTPGATCDTAHPASWPDVPWDQNCAASPCTGKVSPTFWSAKRLSTVQTQYLSGASYVNVELWTLTQSYPDPRDGTSAALWLARISHAGQVGGSATMPDVVLNGTLFPNRYWAVDGLAPLEKERISSIVTDTDAKISVNYLPAECSSSNLPSAPETNTKRCFPQWWTPAGFPSKVDWFNKYPVSSVVADAVTGGAQPMDQTYYDYSLGVPHWRWDNSPLVQEKHRTWSVFAGYSKVRVSRGDVNTPAGRETTDFTFFQGMDGDRAGPSGGTKSASVAASDGTSVTDSPWWAGRIREQISYKGVGGPQTGGQITLPYASAVTANDGVITARHTGDADVVTRTALSAGGFRSTEIKTSYDDNGRVVAADDRGDIATATDDLCTRTSYADNTTAWLMDFPAESATVAKACTATPSYPADAVSDTRAFYDGSATVGAAPSKGQVTRTDVAKAYSGSTPQWLTIETNSYDALGRETSSTDALSRRTTTAYTPAGAGPLTQETVTNPLGWTTTVAYAPAWGEETSAVDANQHTTTATYDPLGRRTQVWLPDRPQVTHAGSPSMSYAYAVPANGPVSVATTVLTPAGATSTSYTLFDGLLRLRQTQVPSEAGGAVVTDTLYDAAGRTAMTYHDYYISAVPSATLFLPLHQTDIPGATSTVYDGAGRSIADVMLVDGTERWRTSYAYGGDHIDTTPPAGGTPTTTYTDARGNTTKLLQYHGTSPTGTADATTYGYDPAGQMTSMTDAAGNHWGWTFDLLGRQIAASDPDRGSTSATYDDADRTVSATDARGSTLAYTYDALDRQTGEYQGSTSGTLLASWAYDTLSKGQMTSATRYIGSDVYTEAVTGYDAADRQLGMSVTLPASQGVLAGTYTTSWAYNADGSLATQDDPAAGGLPAETITSTYSALGNLTRYAGLSAYLYSISYGGMNEVTQTRHYNGINSLWDTYSYEEGTRRLNHVVANTNAATNNVAADRVYAYDDVGDITSIADAPAGRSADTQCFDYDYLQRLTEAWTPATGGCAAAPSAANLGGAAAYWQSYSYDLTGNRLSVVRHSTTGGTDASDAYAYPAPGSAHPHAVQTITHSGIKTGTDSYSVDAGGNTLSRLGQTLTWDSENRLSSVSTAGGIQRNIYDAGGNLLIQSDPTGVTAFLGDTELHLAAGTGTLTGVRTYTALGAARAVRTATAGVGGSTVTWLDTDPQGTGDVTVNPGTDAITVRHLDPFGSPRDAVVPRWPDNHGFLNKPVDAFTTTVHLGARDYDPPQGRFLSADPIVAPYQPQQNNGYSYAQNNPTTTSDPTGLMRPDPPTGGGSSGLKCSGGEHSGGCYHPGDDAPAPTPPRSRDGGAGDDSWNNPSPRCSSGSMQGGHCVSVGTGEHQHWSSGSYNCGGYECSAGQARRDTQERRAKAKAAAEAAAAAAAHRQHHTHCGIFGCVLHAVTHAVTHPGATLKGAAKATKNGFMTAVHKAANNRWTQDILNACGFIPNAMGTACNAMQAGLTCLDSGWRSDECKFAAVSMLAGSAFSEATGKAATKFAEKLGSDTPLTRKVIDIGTNEAGNMLQVYGNGVANGSVNPPSFLPAPGS